MPADFDEHFHFPSELIELLTDTISHLIRSKRGVIDLFRSAGVGPGILRQWDERVTEDRESVKKHEIARAVLIRINTAGDRGLGARRALVRRIAEWEDFSTCWEPDRLPAQGLVAQVRALVHRHDSFARMEQERTKERSARIQQQEQTVRTLQEKRNERDQLQKLLHALFAVSDPWARGKRLEAILNKLFSHYEIAVREAFTVRGNASEGIVEQIDGVLSVDGHLYLVEIKWHKAPLGADQIAQMLVRAFLRADVRSLMISESGFADTAVAECRKALTKKVVVLAELREIVHVLERDRNLTDWIRTKANAAELDGEPFKLIL